jgi:hypothetical protein
VTLVRTDVSEEPSAVEVTRIGELGTTLAVTSNRRTLRKRVALVRTDVSEEHSASIIRVTRIGELAFLRNVRRLLVTANFVPSAPILVTLMMEALVFPETSLLTRATRRNIPEDGIVHFLSN